MVTSRLETFRVIKRPFFLFYNTIRPSHPGPLLVTLTTALKIRCCITLEKLASIPSIPGDSRHPLFRNTKSPAHQKADTDNSKNLLQVSLSPITAADISRCLPRNLLQVPWKFTKHTSEKHYKHPLKTRFGLSDCRSLKRVSKLKKFLTDHTNPPKGKNCQMRMCRIPPPANPPNRP